MVRFSHSGERWQLPGGEPQSSDLARVYDRSNLIDSVEAEVQSQLNLDVPWMTYLGDFEHDSQLCRVYAHPLQESPEIQPAEGTQVRWLTAEEIGQLNSSGKLAGGYERQVVDLWLDNSYLRGTGQSKARAMQAV